ncbi:AAA family ATPase [Nocardiopsis terrae]
MRYACPTPGCPTTAPTRTTRCEQCTRRNSRAHKITLVCGPPCSGKNTWVAKHAQPGDLIVDLDALYTAVNANPTRTDHDQPAALTPFAFDARDAITNRLLHGDHNLRAAWIIHSAPEAATRAEWKQRGANIVMITADQDTLTHRAQVQRPNQWGEHIQDWHRRYTLGHVDRTVTTG